MQKNWENPEKNLKNKCRIDLLYFFRVISKKKKKKHVLLKLRPTWMYHFPNLIFYSSGSQSSDHIVGIIFFWNIFLREHRPTDRDERSSLCQKKTHRSSFKYWNYLKEGDMYNVCTYIWTNKIMVKLSIYVIMKNISVVGLANDFF